MVAILGFFGVETTSFAALVAAAGVAIGMAWSGLLANFAAGVFLVILQPIKVGDFATAGAVSGTVKEVGLFVTAIDTPDNVHTIVGNGKILGDTIQNFSHNSYRRVELAAQLAHGVDAQAAIAMLKRGMAQMTDSGKLMNLFEVAHEIANRLIRIFLRHRSGRRPVYGGTEKFQTDPEWKDYVLFNEYFHGTTGRPWRQPSDRVDRPGRELDRSIRSPWRRRVLGRRQIRCIW